MKAIFKKLKGLILRKYFIYHRFKNPSSCIYISYISEPFYRKWDRKYMSNHQSKSEVIELANVLKDKNCNFVVEDYSAQTKFLRNKFDVVLGLEPNFEIISFKNPNAFKIYYATGAYWKHQNRMIEQRTDAVNAKYKINIPYSRTVGEHTSSETADMIIQIGSRYTIETYPVELRKKIKLIDQSSYEFKNIDLNSKVNNIDKKSFIWFGSGGSILKGIDLIIEYFSERKDLTLHVVGPIDLEFKSQFLPFFKESLNIHFHGFMKIESKEFRKLVETCTFMIYPSASEGCPGSVINLMKLGIIPIVSKWSTFDGIEKCGFILEDLSLESIHKCIREAEKLCDSEIHDRIWEASNITCERFTLSNYKNNIRTIFQDHINK